MKVALAIIKQNQVSTREAMAGDYFSINTGESKKAFDFWGGELG